MQDQSLAQYVNNAHAANSRRDFGLAERLCKKALKLAPTLPQAWYNLGVALGGLGKRSDALKAFEKTRCYTVDSADAQNNIGLQLTELGAYAEAERCLKHALKLKPAYAAAHSNLGRLFGKLKRFDEAEAAFRNAIERQPDLAPLHTNLGATLNILKNHEAAEAACRKAVELDPFSSTAWCNWAAALLGLKRFEAAEAASRKAIELDAFSADALVNFAGALNGQKRFEDAAAACRKSLELDASSPEAWDCLGHSLLALLQYEAAADCFRECLKLNPDAEFLLGQIFLAKMRTCDWRSFAKDLSRLVQEINQGMKASPPFFVLGVSMDLALQRRAAEIWCNYQCPEQSALGPIPHRTRANKIRIGYYSADFHNHATSYLMAELFELHDKDQFELIGFSFGPDKSDAMRKRVAAAFDRFVDVRDMSAKSVAQLSREMEIDIAIDLKGYTEDCRTEIFSYRAAPIQVNYLGYPGTMGASYIDYVIADKTLIPTESQAHYTEKIVYLPNTYQVNDSKRKISDRLFTREELGLPTKGFIFCCFNNNYKINPSTFDSWMHILKQVDNSVLWLFEDNPAAAANLAKEAALRGIDPARLVFATHMPLDEHLARIRIADLFIDTLPYNAHTTASDALWAGVPVLTCIGDAFASRVAASLLKAIDLPELITTTQEEFEAIAIDLASHPERLTHLKHKLEQNRLTTPLFNAPLFAKHIETAYLEMYENYIQGLSPEHIYIKHG